MSETAENKNWYSERWGESTQDEALLFELLTVGAFQSGLSWKMVTNKRAVFKKHFCNYDIKKVAALFPEDIRSFLADPEMIRNQRKIKATITNARAILGVQNEFGSFYNYLNHFFDGKVLYLNNPPDTEISHTLPIATQIAKDMKKRGFKFVGPIVTLMFLKSAGFIKY